MTVLCRAVLLYALIEVYIIHCRGGKRLTSGYWFMGVARLTEPELDEIIASGKPRSISGYGVLSIDPNIPAEKVFSAISGISIRGKVSCTPEVREHYGL